MDLKDSKLGCNIKFLKKTTFDSVCDLEQQKNAATSMKTNGPRGIIFFVICNWCFFLQEFVKMDNFIPA